jgi:hypothetical protein
MSAFGVLVDSVADTLKAWSPQLRSLVARILKLEQQTYSENLNFLEEFETNKLWFDRKVFKKLVNIGALPNNTTKSVAHNITFQEILSITGIGKGSTTWINLPTPHTTAASSVRVTVDATNINIITTSNYSGTTGWILLEYTKKGL